MRRRLRRVGAGVLLGAVLTVAAGGTAFGDDPQDIPLRFPVTDTATTPATSGGAVRNPGAGGSGSSSRPAADSSSAEVLGAESVPSAIPSAGTETLGGVLAIGGLNTSYSSSRNPLVGTVHVQMTVQNLSTESIEPTVDLWLTNGLGMQLSQQTGKSLGVLGPGELRVADADLAGVGQWTLLDVHMRLTPPDQIDGVALEPLTRDRWIFAPPWFVLAALAIGATGAAAWRWSTRIPSASGLAASGPVAPDLVEVAS